MLQVDLLYMLLMLPLYLLLFVVVVLLYYVLWPCITCLAGENDVPWTALCCWYCLWPIGPPLAAVLVTILLMGKGCNQLKEKLGI